MCLPYISQSNPNKSAHFTTIFTTMLTDELLISQFSLMSIHIIQEEALAKAAAAKAKAKAKAAEAKAKAKAKAEAAEAKAKADAVGFNGRFFWGEPMGKPMGYFWDISIGIFFIQWENQWVSMNLERGSQYAADAAVACSFWDATSLADRMVYIIWIPKETIDIVHKGRTFPKGPVPSFHAILRQILF